MGGAKSFFPSSHVKGAVLKGTAAQNTLLHSKGQRERERESFENLIYDGKNINNQIYMI